MQPVDILIVFGEGPVKPLLLPDELTPAQKKEWFAYTQDPTSRTEPNFAVIAQRKYLQEIDKIDGLKISHAIKARLKEQKRQEWQCIGWFALKSWGRQNALAAGSALYEGTAKKVILSGGRTRPEWIKKILPKERIANWPSEAELMKDIITSHYSHLYKKKFQTDIESTIILENTATNTIENFVYSINIEPQMLTTEITIGLLSAQYHLQRLTILASLFSLPQNRIKPQSAQKILKKTFNHAHMSTITRREKRWITGLTTPKYLDYWLGYLGLVNEPIVIQNAINKLKENEWKLAAKELFKKLELDFEEYEHEHLPSLKEKNPSKYDLLVRSLRRLREPEYRTLPPAPATL